MGKLTEFKQIRVDKLRPYQKNAKKHSEEQVEAIAKSIEEFGFLSPLLVDKDLNIIAGHGRVLACKKLGIEEVPCVFAEGLTQAQRQAYILADNKLTELGEWDEELISQELQDLKKNGFDIEVTGFTFDDIISDDFTFPEDEAEEPDHQETPKTAPGEIYKLGRHILMCGDSTKREDVERLMGGQRVDLAITDPPYNVGVVGGTDEHLTIENDDMPDDDFRDFLEKAIENMAESMKEGAAFYVWHASRTQAIFEKALMASGLEVKQQLVWVKNVPTLGRQDYQWKHEVCFYGWKEGAAHYFIDDRSKTTIIERINAINWDELRLEEAKSLLKEVIEGDHPTTTIYENKPLRSAEHPTMKPVNLITRLILNSSKPGEIVLDLFGGSGTTLICCEQTERSCYMMEYDPGYVDVIIDRWERLTGERAEKL